MQPLKKNKSCVQYLIKIKFIKYTSQKTSFIKKNITLSLIHVHYIQSETKIIFYLIISVIVLLFGNLLFCNLLSKRKKIKSQ